MHRFSSDNSRQCSPVSSSLWLRRPWPPLSTSVTTLAPTLPQSPTDVSFITEASVLTTVFTPSEARACLQSIPFSESNRQDILTSLRAFLPLGIFKYNQIHDDSALNQGVDVFAELDRIEKANYGSDYDFQNDISRVIYSLK